MQHQQKSAGPQPALFRTFLKKSYLAQCLLMSQGDRFSDSVTHRKECIYEYGREESNT